MPKPPLPAEVTELLARPNPSVITSLRPDGSPVSVATWYLWDEGRVLVNMDKGRTRVKYLQGDPRTTITVLAEDDWYTHVSLQGRVVEWADDEGLRQIDRLSTHYRGQPYPTRDRERISAWIEVERWHGWGSAKASDNPENAAS